MDILEMSGGDLQNFSFEGLCRDLSFEEILHIFSVFKGFWQYDYKAAEKGRVGNHAELKSGRCSDGFLYSKTVLSHPNLCKYIAIQMAINYRVKKLPTPDYVVGVPDGATELGKFFAQTQFIKAKIAEMIKENGRIKLVSSLQEGDSILFIEDLCTRGTGLKEAFDSVLAGNPLIKVIPYEPVIVNRGGLREIKHGDFTFSIIPVITYHINDWDKAECPLCKMGSVPIRPKASEENWKKLVNSQK